MKIANTQTLNEQLPIPEQIRILQTQIDKLYLCLQGRVDFGVGYSGLLTGSDTDTVFGQNIDGEFKQIKTGNADTNQTFTHHLGSVPLGYIVLWQDKAGTIYKGTTWNTTQIDLKCNVAAVTFLVFIVKQGATY